MGGLTARVHGSIAVVAAVAVAASTSDNFSEKLGLKKLSRYLAATGGTVLVSPLYLGALSQSGSFELSPPVADGRVSSFSFSSSPMSVYRASVGTGITPPSSSIFTSKSKCLKVYKARSASSGGNPLNSFRSNDGHAVPIFPVPLNSLQTLSRSFDSLPDFPKGSVCPLLPSRLYFVSPTIREISLPLSSQGNQLYPCVVSQGPVASLKTLKLTFLCGTFSFPNAFQFERFASILYRSYSLSPYGISSKLLHTWHAAAFNSQKQNGNDNGKKDKPTMAVVLLGWLGAQQKHLRKYADWYTSRGIHAVTFVVPMKDFLSFKPGDKAERHIDMLTLELTKWLKNEVEEGGEKYIIFHTFSNTGWLTYGAILERLLPQGDGLLDKIKGCVVDSAPAAKPDPQVWASGFSAALLKKRSIATHCTAKADAGPEGKSILPRGPDLTETAIHAMLEKFFRVFLRLPYVDRRLADITSILSKQQPPCPQLYIYSTADTVIPVELVESFIGEQKKAGRTVRACDFQLSPHVDHFRTFPDLYSDQLNRFLRQCIPEWPSD
eukprot:c19099_g2_i1 orf=81-1730(+)